MAKNVTPFSIGAPGFLGLNLQDSPVEMDQRFMLEAINCVIDQYGRVAARKGWTKVHASNTELSTSNVTCIGEVVTGAGTLYTVAAGGGYLFKHASTTLTTLTYGGGGVAPTISANNWQFVQLNGVGVFFQRGYDPLIFDPAVSATAFRRVSEKTGYTGTIPTANCALSAYGRIWCADTATDKNTVTWSDLLTVHNWTGGTSGSLNLVGVWPLGGDEVTALAAHNNRLIIFGKKQTLIYSGADDPATMALEDAIINVGCIARDSVQNTGEDVLFLSNDGVRSLSRTIQEKSAPLRTLSRNVQMEMQQYIGVETIANVKSGYSPVDAIYMLTLPASSLTYCFDIRSLLQDGSARVTMWNNINPKCFAFMQTSRKLYIGQAGYIGEYTGYNDNDTATYLLSFLSTWVDFGNPIQGSILKRILGTFVCGDGQVITFKWGFDFASNQGSQQVTIELNGSPAEYGEGEYAEDEYGVDQSFNVASCQPGGAGRLVQCGITAQIDGAVVSIQKIDMYTKDARVWP